MDCTYDMQLKTTLTMVPNCVSICFFREEFGNKKLFQLIAICANICLKKSREKHMAVLVYWPLDQL